MANLQRIQDYHGQINLNLSVQYARYITFDDNARETVFQLENHTWAKVLNEFTESRIVGSFIRSEQSREYLHRWRRRDLQIGLDCIYDRGELWLISDATTAIRFRWEQFACVLFTDNYRFVTE